jgi:hypothetical protein
LPRGSNIGLSIKDAGTYRFKLNTTEAGAPTLTVAKVD